MPSISVRSRLPTMLGALACASLVTHALAASVAAAPSAGYRDFDFGTSVTNTPTGEKPESKLWWNDGWWWGSLWDPVAKRYAIHRFDPATQSWSNTGVAIDNRGATKSDALWDGTRLYVVSHVFSNSGSSTSSGNAARLYRFSYDAGPDAYSLDSGFPVNVNSSKSETLVLDKDYTGKLWITWIEGGKVKINRSLTDDRTWGSPFDLPVQGAKTDSDDISSLGFMAGNRIGVLWSNQKDKRFYFAVHRDGDPDTKWDPRETALQDASLGDMSDDHINLKLSCDPSGAAYAAVKTSLDSSNEPMVYVLRRLPNGTWSRHLFGNVRDNHTRPVLLVDIAASKLHVFAQSNRGPGGRQAIYVKSANLSDLQFPSGLGTPFIDSSEDEELNNPTTTKQCVDGTTGILVLASDEVTHYYLHNTMNLGGVGPTTPVVAGFQPGSGPVGTQVTVTGLRLAATSQVEFNGVTAAFSVTSDTEVLATVPAGATTGRIRVTTPAGNASSASDFVVVGPPAIASFAPGAGPIGTEVTISGSGFTGASQVTFNGTAALAFTVVSDASIRATVPAGVTTGRIAVTTPYGSGESASDFVVTAGSTSLVLRPVHDAQIKSSSPTTNYGQLESLRIRSVDPAYQYYAKFDVAGLAGPVTSATLRVFVTDDSDKTGAIHAASNDYRNTSTPWTENGLNWNNAPPILGPALDSLGAVARDTWAEFDVTAAITGNGTFSFVCRTTSTKSCIVSSDEGPRPPELVVETGLSMIAPDEAMASAVQGIATRPLALAPGRPNPFRTGTDLSFDLPEATRVDLVIYDVRGRAVRTLVHGVTPAGPHVAHWDGLDDDGHRVPNGIYFARLEAPSRAITRKLILIH